MRISSKLYVGVLAPAVLAVLSFQPAASASMIGVSGHLSIGNCGGGGATVTATTFIFMPLATVADGCMITGGGTTLMYWNGSAEVPLASPGGTTGEIKDNLVAADFMTFLPAAPGLHFDLAFPGGAGPGSPTAVCTGLTIGQSCSVVVGSPFILTDNSTGTAVSISLRGTATDLSGIVSTWTGALTTQINGKTPDMIQTIILGGGSVGSTYSGEFDAVVPEPITISMIGGALMALGIFGRRRRRA